MLSKAKALYIVKKSLVYMVAMGVLHGYRDDKCLVAIVVLW